MSDDEKIADQILRRLKNLEDEMRELKKMLTELRDYAKSKEKDDTGFLDE